MKGSSDAEAYLSLAKQVAKEIAARLRPALDGRESIEVSEKSPGDLVTNLDLWAEEYAVQKISEAFPEHSILGEESTAQNISPSSEDFDSKLCWCIDPIDGTSNFVNKIPHVAVSIALFHKGERLVGLVEDVCRDITYSAIRGQGAWANSRELKSSNEAEIKKSIFATGYPYKRQQEWSDIKTIYENFFKLTRDMRTFGAAALDQCWVAEGKIQAFFELGLAPWDVAAGSLIVEEAGGISTNPIKESNLNFIGFHKSQEIFNCFSKSFLFCGSSALGDRVSDVFSEYNLKSCD